MYAIEIKDLVKMYGEFLAVDNVSLKIEKGRIYGILGPNGAGKSTIINIICGLLRANSGTIKINNIDVTKSMKGENKKVGLVPQEVALYLTFTAEENLKFFGEIYGLKGRELKENIEKALEFTGLLEVRKKLAKDFSGGMLRRLNIACALVHNPEIIIMDEPTVGIDPQSRNHILESVKKLNKNGTTIIYTTHYMEEAEILCDEIAIIDHGKVIASGSKEKLKNLVSDTKDLNLLVDNGSLIEINEFKKISGVKDVIILENKISISSSKDINNLGRIIDKVNYFGANILDIGYKEVTLETVFLTLTGRSLRD
ncbi:ABC transporter ATP-binding protein [Eubacterium multiforme]|uniref:ABC-2 type transport system ATP-binding protein n=1 Tax=Eubacterium multiforme TaxID=83339 RepID=A0ABT9UQM5_9FIRM|nr:ATP-binding cassette domain-containing protein [Eubacterium multiforme]MDQ0148607.1 ABC-2 type transport system ATP-binding protein [Eubacterium multiforme]